MSLAYPNVRKAVIPEKRRILADQMDYMIQGAPSHSRLRN